MYYLVIISVLFASLNSIFLHFLKIDSVKKLFLFNFIISLIWFILLLAFSKFNFTLNVESAFWGMLYAIVQISFLIFKMLAMSRGSVSITTLIGNFSLVLSTILSAILWQERVTIPRIFGIIILLFSIILVTKNDKNSSFDKKQLIFCALFFVFGSAVGIVFKCFSKYSKNNNATEMMLYASFFMTILLLIISSIFGKKGKISFNVKSRYFLFVILCGILSCVYNRLNLYLTANLDGNIFFPIFNGGVIILSAILSVICFKEKLNKRTIIGLIVGTLSLIIITAF